MKKKLISSIMSAVLLALLIPGLGLAVFATTYTITFDPNGGTPGPNFVSSTTVTINDSATAAPEAWFTPNYHVEDVAPPDGMEFDCYEIAQTRVAPSTAVQFLIIKDQTIKYLWKPINYYTVTYDANGGIKGPDWVDSEKVRADRSDWYDYLPSPQDNIVRAPDGMEFDYYDINGKKVAAHTSTMILLTEDLNIKYVWKSKSDETYIYDGIPDVIFKKKSLKPLRFRFTRKVSDDLTFQSFVKLLVDGTELSRKRYIISRGSLNVELNADYLETLPEGDHTLQPVFTDGDGPVVTFIIEKEGGSDSGGSHSHEHCYVWETVKEATPDSDGEMIYACSKCGEVSQRIPITGYVAFNKEIADKIKAALPGSEVRVSTDKWISLYSVALDGLTARPDVRLVIDFIYGGKQYEVAVPAGTNAQALKDGNGYAGFLYLGSMFGLTEIPE